MAETVATPQTSEIPLHPRLAGAAPEARGRALAKAARVLSRMRPDEPLRGHTADEERSSSLLRRIVVRQAYNDDTAAIAALADSVVEHDDGVRWLIRALNNLRRLDTRAATSLSLTLLESLEGHVDGSTFARVLAKQLVAIRRSTSFTERVLAIAERTLEEPFADPTDVRTWLLQELVSTDLRLDADSDHLARKRGPLRPIRLRHETRQRLERELQNPDADWSKRLAALWLLGAADSAGLETAKEYVPSAFETFPLEALSALEQTQVAFEAEAAGRGDEIRLADRIVSLRREAVSGGPPDAELLADALHAAIERATATRGALAARDALELADDAAGPAGTWAWLAVVDPRSRHEVVTHLERKDVLAATARRLFAEPALEHAGRVRQLASALLAGLRPAPGEDDDSGLESALIAWEQAVADEDTARLPEARRRVLDALG